MANITIGKNGNYAYIDFGDYYPTIKDEGYHYFPRSGFGGVCKKKIDSEEGIEFHINHEPEPFNLSHQSGLTYFYQVDSVNGITPTSIDHLRDLIIDLII
jgi:hypothetical protein